MQLRLQAVRNATSRYHNTKSVTEKLAGPRLEVTRIHDDLTLLDFAMRVKTHLTLPYIVINDQMDCIHQLTTLMSTHELGLFYGKPFYYLLCKLDILYIISDI